MEYNRIVISKFGSPEVLQKVSEKELPRPEKGQVRVKVLTTSACFTDTLIRRGLYLGVKKKPPFSPGYDLVGIVDELGEEVKNLSIGQKVAELTVIGAYTEYICLDASSVVPVPENLDNTEAVSFDTILSYSISNAPPLYQYKKRTNNFDSRMFGSRRNCNVTIR